MEVNQYSDCQGSKMIDKPIFLIGMMGSGKSSLASALSKELSIPLLDTDQAIEKAVGLTVVEIFSCYGEAFFRAKEQELTVSLKTEAQIVACGGGLPCHHELIKTMLKQGLVIYLEAPIKILFDRIAEDNERPLLSGIDDFYLRFLEREAVYKLAHHVLDATKSEQQLLKSLRQLINTSPF